MKEQLRQMALNAGAEHCRFAEISDVDARAITIYDEWLSSGRHGTMGYMERYGDVRKNPELLLEGARSLMICLFNYNAGAERHAGYPRVADYALGSDYHEVLRARLKPVVERMAEEYGASSRICIDTAPLRERYWAAKAGLGFIGRNNQLIVPGEGSAFFIATIVTTLAIDGDEALQGVGCGTCHACIDACPTKALVGDGSCDTSRCLSYLTIENRDELPDGINLASNIYGCDACRLACPHNKKAKVTEIDEFKPREAVLELSLERWLSMSDDEFRAIFKGSAVKRAKLKHLQELAKRL
jgi:epoxyqueuosine reductase